MSFNGGNPYLSCQFGMPLFGIAGLMPWNGNTFWVDETNGSDGNTGGPNDPLATLSQAHSLCTAENNDVVLFTGTIHTASTLTWSKNKTHLIGLGAPSNNTRSRITQTSTATVFTPLVNVTAQGCVFKNIGTFYGFANASTQICWAEAGGRNYYENVEFQGGGDATAAAQAGMRSITVGGGGENKFHRCTFGLDTVVRATNSNATLEVISGSARNVITDSIFQAECTAAGDTHVLIAANGMDRYLILDNCVFNNFGATSLTAAISNAGGSPAGSVIVNNCISVGASAIAGAGEVYVNQISAGGATTTYVGLHAT